MDTTSITLNHLFEQLGLDASPTGIEHFITTHNIPNETPISQASFWNEAQKAFITEALTQDAQWSELVDQLDVLLRQ
ncbi:DUF2789 domain-containing protein [Shewanella japonica]|uniref:DUF2789 domain-containing protein n=1 Tax=Shewanella japonica TaxID=93973 RepID=UPI00249452AC|nr:DUF2789 domain-containing protein [Shewanella japonica]